MCAAVSTPRASPLKITNPRAAKSDDDARRVFRSLLHAFGDAHLDIDWTSRETEPETSQNSEPLCTRLGFAAQGNAGIDFTQFSEFLRVDDADSGDFPGGVLQLAGGQKLGILRISLFMEKAHPALCEAARTALEHLRGQPATAAFHTIGIRSFSVYLNTESLFYGSIDPWAPPSIARS